MAPDRAPTLDDVATVRLRVPADPRYARVVRVAASAYAVRFGLAPVDVGDLRLAVDEALVVLLGTSGDGPASGGSVAVRLGADDGTLEVELELQLDGTAVEPPLAPRAAPGALARFHEIVPSGITVLVADPDGGRVVLSRRR